MLLPVDLWMCIVGFGRQGRAGHKEWDGIDGWGDFLTGRGCVWGR